jgi:very-short-patch-repair endonuclease
MSLLHNRKEFKKFRQYLRRDMPDAEVIVWSYLQGRRLSGYKFRRQHGIGRYVVDFYCPKAKLVIELDGDSHFQDGAEERDERRQKFIEDFGLRVLRFTNTDVYENIGGVLDTIIYYLDGEEI